MARIGQKFEAFMEAYRRPDGRQWSGQNLQDATNGTVTRSYVSALRKGVIENPGYEKLAAIAKAMGFPPQLWFEEGDPKQEPQEDLQAAGRRSLAARLNRLFETIRHENTDLPYTNAEVARMSLGDLTEEEVEGVRSGKNANPSVSQVVALADAFGVAPSYFLDNNKKPPLLDAEAIDGLRDETTNEILHKSVNLPAREREMVLGIIRQFEGM